jgi:hypothetical protein
MIFSSSLAALGDLVSHPLANLPVTPHGTAVLAGALLVFGVNSLGVLTVRGGSLSVSYAGLDLTLVTAQ